MKKNIKIVLIKDGEIIPLSGEDRKMRISHLMRYFKDNKINATWITTDFLHGEKKFIKKRVININIGCIRLFKSLGYYNNLSPRRFIHTIIYTFRVFIYLLINKKEITHILISYPTPETLFMIWFYLKIIKKPIIIDIRDKWPPSVKLGIIYSLYAKIQNYLLSKLSITTPIFVLSISNDLLIWFKNKTKNLKSYHSEICPIGCNEEYSFKRNYKNIDNKHRIKFLYIGSLGINYDITNIVTELKKLAEEKNKDYEINIVGSGTQFGNLKNIYSTRLKIKLHGFKKMKEINQLIAEANIGLVPHRIDGLIPNKVGEYLSGGLFIISTIKGKCADLLSNNNIGYTVKRDLSNLDIAIDTYSRMKTDEIMHNSKNLYVNRFYAPKIYQKNLTKLYRFIVSN